MHADRKQELIDAVLRYDAQADADAIARAYDLAEHAHGDQMRASGESYFTHPLAVAFILTELKLDTASIITALLHDTVEDTELTLQEVERDFGEEVARLVDGVTKLTKLETKSEHIKQAENFRKLVVAMSEDLRVLLVKLADRLHNMETLHFIKKEEKRKRIAHETLEIYAALAERIGLRMFKDRLQDIAFAELYPEARESILYRLEYLRENGQESVQKTVENLQSVLKQYGIEAEVYGREKRPYSIWKKMEKKNISFEQLSDVIAFRIVTGDTPDCYRALGAVHAEFHTVPGRFKDYISTPKSNGYKSIHTAVIGPDKHIIEIQIRSRAMHRINEYGVAAHWAYKQDGKAADRTGTQFRWIRELLDILEKAEGAEEFLEHTKLEMYHDQVFCFTPKGDVIALPKGATPVDFAFAVHSGVGATCVGAKVNGRIVPLKSLLRNGDQVEIVTSKAQTPSPGWEQFVVTGKARTEIRRFIRTQKRKEYVSLGKAVLTKTFRQAGHELTEKMLEPVLDTLEKDSVESVYAAVGEGTLNRNDVLHAVFPIRKNESVFKRAFTFPKLRGRKEDKHRVPIKGLIPGMAMHFAGCCHPIPGDRIVGIVTTGKGITIHTIDCETLENFNDMPERWIDVAWNPDSDRQPHVGRLKITMSHESGSLAALSNAIARDMGNINNLKITSRSADFFELMLDVEVQDVRHLNNVIATLRALPNMYSVERFVS